MGRGGKYGARWKDGEEKDEGGHVGVAHTETHGNAGPYNFAPLRHLSKSGRCYFY